MKWMLISIALLGLEIAGAWAAEPLPPRKGEVPASGLYVPVSLDGYASHRAGMAWEHTRVTAGGVPFDLVSRPNADNLFLKSAEWPDWKEDPSSY